MKLQQISKLKQNNTENINWDYQIITNNCPELLSEEAVILKTHVSQQITLMTHLSTEEESVNINLCIGIEIMR